MIKIDENKISYFVRVNNKCIDVDNGYIIDEDDGMDYFYCDITELFETNERGVCLLNRLYKNATDWEKMFVKMRLERKASDADKKRQFELQTINGAKATLYNKKIPAIAENDYTLAYNLAMAEKEIPPAVPEYLGSENLKRDCLYLYHDIEDYFLADHVGDIFVKDNTMYLVLPKHGNVLGDDMYYHQYQILPIDSDPFASVKTITFQDVIETKRDHRCRFIPSVLKDTISKYTPPFLFQVMTDEIDYRNEYISHLGDDWEKLDFEEKKYRYKAYCEVDERYERIYKEISDYSSIAADAIALLTGGVEHV